MSVAILYSNLFRKHDPPYGFYHPENSRRLDIALNGIERAGLSNNVINLDTLDTYYHGYRDRVHHNDYISFIRKACDQNTRFIDGDTYINKYTFEVATHAIGCSVYALELALNMRESLVVALVRPPGHHAGFSGRAMGAPTQGFCIFNNVAATALYAIDKNLKPALIIDIDVHHGNGTQEIFWRNPDIVHIDIHEYGIYPGTGLVDDLGEGEGYGTKINIPLHPYSGNNDYIYVLHELVLPIAYSIKPKSIIISAGFDAYMNDGLASMELTDVFYAYFGSILRTLSKDFSVGIVAILEGGYGIGIERGLPSFLKGFVKPMEIMYKDVEPSKRTIYTVKQLHEILRSIYNM